MVAGGDGGIGHRHEDTSVIYDWLTGGPQYMNMYDIKPNSPAEYRGTFQPITTNVLGLDECELTPLYSQ